MSRRADSRINLTAGPIAPGLFRLAWPLVLGNLLQTVYNLADMFWVGRVSPEAVAAVSLMFPLSWLFISTAIGVTAATIALVSQFVGAGNDRRADAVVGQSVLLASIAGTVLALFGYVFRRPLLRWIGADQDPLVFADALAYIEIIFLTLPLTFLFFAFRASLQGAGDTKTAMWIVAISAGVNVVLDPFLILGWWIVPELGTRGAGWATFLSRLLAAVVGIGILLAGSWGIRLRPRDLFPDPQLLRKLIDIGYPATVDGWAQSFAAVVIAALVAAFGPVATAAYGIGIRMMSISWAVAGAVGQAAATGVGQNIGATQADRAMHTALLATATTMGLLFVAGAAVWLFPAPAMRVFVDDPAVIDEGVRFLRIVALSWAFAGGLMVIQGGFRGAGNTRVAMVLSLLSRWGFRFPIAIVVAFGWVVTVPVLGDISIAGFDFGIVGLWWSYAISAVVSFAIGLGWFLRGRWQQRVVEQDSPDTVVPPESAPTPDTETDSP